MDKLKVIVTDIDGCVLRWNSKMLDFLKSTNFPISAEIEAFIHNDVYYDVRALDYFYNGNFLEAYHSSEYGSQLIPVSEHVGPILIELSKKYLIVSLTAFTEVSSTMENRKKNLEFYFPNIFHEHVIISPIGSKEDSLKVLNDKYDIQLFIDDRRKHIEEALKVLTPEKIHHLQNYDQWFDIIKRF